MNDPFLATIERSGFPADELDVLSGRMGSPYVVASRGDIAVPGNSAHDLHILVEGWACRYKVIEDNKRQILAFLLPGDICDLSRLFDSRSGVGVAALTDCKVATLPVGWLREVRGTRPAMGDLLWFLTCREHAAMTEQIVTLGRRTSRQRIAFLLCDLLERLQALGHAEDGRFRSPLTQTDIADALGLSTVHVNRTLQGLRDDGLIEMRGRSLCIPRKKALQRAASYDGAVEIDTAQV